MAYRVRNKAVLSCQHVKVRDGVLSEPWHAFPLWVVYRRHPKPVRTHRPHRDSSISHAMVVYSFYIFDRHTECIYSKKWFPTRPLSASSADLPLPSRKRTALSAQDDAKLIFGTVFSLRNITRKLGGPDDKYVYMIYILLNGRAITNLPRCR